MTTTQNFQKKPNYCNTVDECIGHKYKKINTNPRYPYFNQTHFHCWR